MHESPDQSQLVVTHICEACLGGVARQLRLAARTLPAGGILPRFILSTRRGPASVRLADDLRGEGRPVDEVPMRRSICPLRDLIHLLKIRRILRSTRPALVHTHSSKAGILGRFAAHMLGIPCVHTPHVFAFEWQHGGVMGRLYRMLERRAARWCEALVMLSDLQNEFALLEGVGTLEQRAVVPNGVDPAAFVPPTPQQRQAARACFGVGENVPLIGCAGRMAPQKGIDRLLRAASSLRQQERETEFLVAGTGELLASHRALAERLDLTKAVRFCEEVDDMQRLYHALDVFVLPSLWEGMPYTVLEAQSCGVPVVASRTCGSASIIEDEVSGLLVEIGDERQLMQAMLRLLREPQLAERLGAWGRANVERYFTLEQWSRSLTRLYRWLHARAH